MDNAEQSPRIPSKGSFDTASLLAPSTGIYKSPSPSSVASPLPHLTHSPSAFSVLGHNAVLVPPLLPPPASSKPDIPTAKGGAKMCSPIIHQSASDALSSLASSSAGGSCGWWSTSPPIVSTADFAGCGVTAMGDPFGRAGICGRTPHLPLPSQPRRIVEEVLGHLYAKPASAEFKVEIQTSGIHDAPQLPCKTKAALSPVDLQLPVQLNSLRTISPEKEFLPIKSDTSLLSGIPPNAVPTVVPVPSTSVLKSSHKKAEEPNLLIQPPPKIRKKRSMKAANVSIDGTKNGKRPKVNNEHGRSRTNRKPKEKTAKTLGTESECRGDSSSGTSGVGAAAAGHSRSAEASSSDTTDEDEREKKQELARLKKQQKKLERKVLKLEQASHDSILQKSEAYNKKAPTASKPVAASKIANHTKKPSPSPAHSSSTLAVSPKATPLKAKSNSCVEDDTNMSVPLDLCVKKQEPTFEVSSSSFHSSFSPHLSAMKKQVHLPTFGQPMDHKYPLSTAPKRRGRKPKYLSASNISPEIAHQFKQNNVRDLSSLLLPQKLLATVSPICRNTDMNSFKKNINSSSTPKSSLLVASDLANPLNIPRKNFTLDSLLGESNGNIDSENNLDISPSSSFTNMNLKGKDRLRYSNRIKRLEDSSRDFETLTKPDSSSATDSDVDNDQSDSDESISGNVSTTAGHKRSCDEDGEDFGGKRRRVVPDEREIQIPLEHGWRRETRIRCFSRAGVRGEVTYYTPCGKKLRSYPEVVRYLIRNGITDISRDNFTFSTKVNVGDFLEVTSTGAGEEYVLLTEQDVLGRINEVRAQKGRLGVQHRRSAAHQRSAEREEQQRMWEQKQLQHQLEQQEFLRQAREAKLLKQLQREHALMAARSDKKTKAEEVRRQKEQQRILKQQERFERLEQLRIEREIRAQQALEDQEIKRQQQAFLREQERERRRQHMMLVRALETRKKLEDRERKREEIMFEKRINREKKMEQRRIELDCLRELKKPVEDMMLKDNAPFPEFTRIKGVKLAAKSFGDLLMVFEFLHNFGETLGFDVDNLPTLNSLQMAVLNLDEKYEEELLSVTHHLLACVIEDPGVPHSPEAATVLGQSLKDADITNNNVSEVLRLYFTALDKRSNMCHWLQAKPFLCLNATQKLEILAYVCDDLLGSRVLMRKIDSNIESVNVLRKDKWLIEGDLRRLKTVQQRRLLKAKQQNYEESKQTPGGSIPTDGASSANASRDNNTSNADNSEVKDTSECDKDKLDDLDNESGNESDDERNDSQSHIILSEGEDEDLQLTNEELTKKVDKLSKQLTCYSNKLTKALHTIRAVTFGQDKYHRRYWVLPKAGGVYVESMESSELPHDAQEILAAPNAECENEKPSADELGAEVKTEAEPSQDLKEIGTATNEPVKVENMEMAAEEIPASNQKPAVEEDDSEPKPVEVKKEAEDITDAEIKTEIAIEEISNSDKMDVKPEEVDNVNTSSVIADATNIFSKNAEATEKVDSHPEPDHKNEHSVVKAERKSLKNKNGAIEKVILEDFSDTKKEKKHDVNIFMPKFCDNVGLDNCPPLNHTVTNSGDRKQPLNPSMTANQNWLLHSPFFASLLAGNLMFNGPMMPGREANGTYFNLPKNDFNNPFGPFLGSPNMMTPEQIYKSLNEKPNNQKPWFSILPRMPCDEESLPKSQLAKNLFGLPPMYTHPNLFASNLNSGKVPPPQGTSSHSPSTSAAVPPGGHLSNLQMEILNGVPPGFFLHPFLSHQFGPTYPGAMPVNSSSNSTFTSTPSHSSAVTDFNFNMGRPPASSTPSSIPTPSATPGPSQGCSTPTFRDSPTPSIKKLLMEKITQEYEKPKPIPLELQKGWWRIIDPTQLKDLVNSLHHRGIREKMLQKFLQKHFNYACNSCSVGQDDGVKFELTELDEEIEKLPDGVPVPCEEDSWSRDVALRVDLSILEQIENLEEKIDGASMQIKGWKPTPKISVDGFNKFVPTCELYLQLQVKCDIPDSPREKSPKKSSKKSSARKRRSEAKKRALEAAELAAAAKAEEAEAEEKQDDSAAEKLDDSVKEALEEKEKIIEEPEPEKEPDDFLPPGKMNPVEEAKKRLLMVEAAIERRYLKPPLGFSANELNRSALSGSHPPSENGDEDTIPTGLMKWRNAVQVCRSSSQLAMCLNYLENFTAWDKSIMRASCQFCHSGENEEMLLLCDGCDKGYHTYCFKPKMEKIPEGDWYCYECLNKATGDNVCVICGKKGKLIDCGACPKCFHLSCLDPPLSKMPKAKWYCSGCSQTRPVKKSSKKAPANKDKDKEPKEPTGAKKVDSETKPSKPKGGEKKDRKKEKPAPITEDFAPCKGLVVEMEKHDDSWPFLSPVNTKQFPTYRKVIKKPMDFATVHGKLDTNQYKSREDFANDVRLIFDNCETFNEDDSPVGQAGHALRAFFDIRWTEMCNT